MAGRTPNQISSATTADRGDGVDDAAGVAQQVLDDAYSRNRLQRLRALHEIERRDGDAIAALGVDAGGGGDEPLDLFELLVHGIGGQPCRRRAQP